MGIYHTTINLNFRERESSGGGEKRERGGEKVGGNLREREEVEGVKKWDIPTFLRERERGGRRV